MLAYFIDSDAHQFNDTDNLTDWNGFPTSTTGRHSGAHLLLGLHRQNCATLTVEFQLGEAPDGKAERW